MWLEAVSLCSYMVSSSISVKLFYIQVILGIMYPTEACLSCFVLASQYMGLCNVVILANRMERMVVPSSGFCFYMRKDDSMSHNDVEEMSHQEGKTSISSQIAV